MPLRSRAPFTFACAVAGAAVLTLAAACGSDGGDSSSDSDSTDVVVGFYPLQFVSERVAGDHLKVTNLAQPGAEPHDMELSPKQVAAIASAKLVVFENGFQPALDQAVEENAADHSLDVADSVDLVPAAADAEGEDQGADEAEHDHGAEGESGDEGSLDPHFWLDPTLLVKVASAVADKLGEIDPDHAGDYSANAEALSQQLTALDQKYSSGLASCERTDIVTTHTAFGYLAERYHLTQIGIAGLSPDEEPSSAKLDEVRTFAEEHGVTTIFYEEAVSPDYAQTVADEVGAQTAVLSPLEVAPEHGDYLDEMATNLQTLQTALGCA